MKLLLLTNDLMIGARAEGAARQLDLTTVTVGNPAVAMTVVGGEDCRLLLIDLRLPGLDLATFVQSVRESRTKHLPIVACGPHVHEAKLAAAREAGCDTVVTRGQFDREAEAILSEVMAND